MTRTGYLKGYSVVREEASHIGCNKARDLRGEWCVVGCKEEKGSGNFNLEPRGYTAEGIMRDTMGHTRSEKRSESPTGFLCGGSLEQPRPGPLISRRRRAERSEPRAILVGPPG